MGIENKISTVQLEMQLMQLHSAYLTDNNGSDVFGDEMYQKKDGDFTEKHRMNFLHLQEVACIAITGLFDLGRARRAHFWMDKFDFDANSDDPAWLENAARRIEDRSTRRDGDIYDMRTLDEMVPTV